MKKSILLLLAVFYLSTISFGQSSTVSNAKDWTWLGIDYTHCYFITSIDFVNADDLFEKTKAWNNLVYSEREKYIEKTRSENKKIFETIKKNPQLNFRQADIIITLTKNNRPITVNEMQERYNITYQTARTDLLGLAELGYLHKHTRGKQFLFILDKDKFMSTMEI